MKLFWRKIWSAFRLFAEAGSFPAMIISYSQWHSIGWMILHGIFSWLYIAHCLLTGQR